MAKATSKTLTKTECNEVPVGKEIILVLAEDEAEALYGLLGKTTGVRSFGIFTALSKTLGDNLWGNKRANIIYRRTDLNLDD